MNERWIWVLALCAICTLGMWILRKQSPVSLPVLAVGSTVLVGLFYPVTTLFITPRSWRNIADLSEESLLLTQINYTWFAAGLTLAIGVAVVAWPQAFRVRSEAPQAPRSTVFRDSFVTWGLLGMGSLLYAEYIRRVGLGTLLGTHDFAEKYLESRGLGSFGLGINLMILACLWAEGSPVRRRTKNVLRAVAIGIVIWATAFIAVRTYAAALALGYVMIYCRNRKIQVRQIRLRVVVLLLVGYVGMEAYALLRSTWMTSGDLGSALEVASQLDPDEALGGVIGGSELSHPFLTAMEVFHFEEAGELGGQSYVDAVLAFVPLFIWPGRPATLAERYVSTYYPAMHARGGGSAFTFVGEAWWNFGNLVGPLLAGLWLGLLLMWCHARTMRFQHGLIHRFLPYAVYLTMLFHRNQLQGLFKQVMIILLPCLVLAAIGRLLWEVTYTSRARTRPRALPLAPRHPLEAR